MLCRKMSKGAFVPIQTNLGDGLSSGTHWYWSSNRLRSLFPPLHTCPGGHSHSSLSRPRPARLVDFASATPFTDSPLSACAPAAAQMTSAIVNVLNVIPSRTRVSYWTRIAEVGLITRSLREYETRFNVAPGCIGFARHSVGFAWHALVINRKRQAQGYSTINMCSVV